MNLSAAEQLTHSTIRIECDYQDGTKGTGTGFFFQFHRNEESGNHIPVVITNKHVIKDALRGKLIFTRADTNGDPLHTKHFPLLINDFEKMWKLHPEPDVDLCAMPIGHFINSLNNQGDKLFYRSFTNALLPTSQQLEDMDALEEILMIGYPNGIWDNVNNKPLLRRGTTATHANFDYCGKKEIMIDAACFPGSSGSPVFIFNEGSYKDKRGNMYVGQTKLILLGVLYAGPQYTVEGEIHMVPIATNTRPIVISQIPNNLGVIIKSEKIMGLETLFPKV